MLAGVESGLVGRIVNVFPKHAIYSAIPAHVWRAVGKVPFGHHSPRYVLSPDGRITRAGDFTTRQSFSERSWFEKELRKSAVYRKLENRDPPVTAADLSLYFAIVRRSQELLTTEYPGLRFDVILWPDFVPVERPVYDSMKAEFIKLGIPVHLVTDILPDYNANPEKYMIDPADGHPNALANRILAEYILSRIASNHPGVHDRAAH